MKNLFKETRLATMMVLLFSCVAFISCSDDDKDNSSSLIVGTWSCSSDVHHHYCDGTHYYTFNSNGTYTWECPDPLTNNRNGYYTFDDGLLTISASNGWLGASYLAQFPDKNTLILIDRDGDNMTYKRE